VLSQQASSLKDPDSEREVFRSAGSTVLSWAWFVVAVIVLVDLAVQGRDHAALVTAVLVLTITGVVYACAWRPKIVADSGGIAVVNPVRDHLVPWTAVRKVDVVNAVRVHCEPAPGAPSGKIVYSWAVQSSARSARKTAMRREASSRPGPRLARPRVMQPPPSTGPRGYGELPASAKEALERSPADFTAGRLAERAQHARQAAARAARLSAGAGQPPAAREPSADARAPDDVPLLAGGPPAVDGPATPGEQAGAPAGPGGQPEPWFGTGTEDARPAGEGAGAPADGGPAPGPGPAAGNGAPTGDQAMATAQWAWLSIAAMVVPLAMLLFVALA
jgi:Bacterial PH domain